MSAPYYAHSTRNADRSDWQLLRCHLQNVAEKSRLLAEQARPGDAALCEATRVAGLLHDLGKYRRAFQDMLLGGAKNEESRHKGDGAAVAWMKGNAPIAFAIGGHHGGLPNLDDCKSLVKQRGREQHLMAVHQVSELDCPELRGLAIPPTVTKSKLELDLVTRLVFSCLVDADWADTGEFHHGPSERPPELDYAWLDRVLDFIARKSEECSQPSIALIRKQVLDACLECATQPTGLFALTVPTGGGKTLSGLAFALRHAREHGLRRIIYVAPYLSILEQNARVIREALGFEGPTPAALEHHSLAEPLGGEHENEQEQGRKARLAENWDAPVVITTNVQFFESLFANKPNKCRKLHNIARSVVLLDECQTLPLELIAPTCSMLGQVARLLGTSLVFCTATQPAFQHPELKEARLKDVREIVPASLDLFARLRRVKVSWPKRDETLDWPAVAAGMRQHKQALAVVNTRAKARRLFEELKTFGGTVFHLSTSMCPAHRLAILDEVRELLKAGEPCYLASTQLIEAGVDVDFPCVFRELAPLDSVVQAAGRANREGRLNGPGGEPGGVVTVFRSTDEGEPPGPYRRGREIVETYFLNAGDEPRLDDPASLEAYYQVLYKGSALDKHQIQQEREGFNFAEVARKYALIDNDGGVAVVVFWEEKKAEIEGLLSAVDENPSRAAYRRLAPYQVNLRHYERARASGRVEETVTGLHVWRGQYDKDRGIDLGQDDVLPVV